MSELKVNTISGIAGSVRVNDPVGIGAVAKSGYDLNVDGKVNLEGSVEVITVPASNFGVRIRAPQTATTSPGFGDATLQFTNYAGTTEWASMHAKTDSSLQIRTNNAAALNISSAQVIDHIGQSLFTNKATFNNATQFNGQAIFEQSVIPQCGGTPTVSTHLANKAYVDQKFTPALSSIVVLSIGHPNYSGGIGYGSFNTVIPNASTWLMCWWDDSSWSTSNNDNESFAIGVHTSGTSQITGNGTATFGSYLNSLSGGNSGLGGRWAICFKLS